MATLVTGGAGFVGTNIIKNLLKNGKGFILLIIILLEENQMSKMVATIIM